MVTDILKKKQEEYGHPIYLVSDEPYRKLAYDIEVPYLTHYYENTIVVYSYSKALSIRVSVSVISLWSHAYRIMKI